MALKTLTSKTEDFRVSLKFYYEFQVLEVLFTWVVNSLLIRLKAIIYLNMEEESLGKGRLYPFIRKKYIFFC